MIYIFFMKNQKGNQAPSPTATIIKRFAKQCAPDDLTICLPGYMSVNSKSISQFVNQINLSKHTYFSQGMNGKNPINKNFTIQDEHNSYYKGIPFTFTEDTDHSKMIFFIKKPYDFDIDSENERASISLLFDESCDCFDIKAILIGSSNQSFTTYFRSAKKGEADVLLINGDAINADDKIVEEEIIKMYNNLSDETKRQIVLTKELVDSTNKNILHDIFRKTITNIKFK